MAPGNRHAPGASRLPCLSDAQWNRAARPIPRTLSGRVTTRWRRVMLRGAFSNAGVSTKEARLSRVAEEVDPLGDSAESNRVETVGRLVDWAW